ncbi:MAG: hypothetical protein KatS3mg108_2464 [Isosphaeraceae bacterium]|nr:MAG: hypothetical protein KatS3mg108_2464 [Isosphaeraceae bacterium]
MLLVLTSGIAWADLPIEQGRSYQTCSQSCRKSTAAGVWQRMFGHPLTWLRIAGRLVRADALIDAALLKASLKGQVPAQTPASAGHWINAEA